MSGLQTFLGGVLSLAAVLGIGAEFTRRLGSVPGPWRLSTSMVAGVSIFDLAVSLLLYLAAGCAV